MPPDRDRAALEDIVHACRRIIDFAAGMDRSSFLSDQKTQSAVIHQLLILGEAVKRLSPAFCDDHPDVPWRQIARTRDILIHHYQEVDLEEVWQMVETDIDELLKTLGRLMDGQ